MRAAETGAPIAFRECTQQHFESQDHAEHNEHSEDEDDGPDGELAAGVEGPGDLGVEQ
ncbi:hypothetical protein [Pseudarthrobacter sp.]|uniref:hypothetical protein n=1 Tax=Pseudarthrobacter sp. TaxID=1934409 RepID=UPI002FC7EFB5